MEHSEIEAIIENRKVEREPLAKINWVDENTITINQHIYNIDTNVQAAFDMGAFTNAFNPVLENYDYIVGDWGYGQLRLKGFYDDDRNVDNNLKHNTIPDYLVDYVNFGSKYFVLHNLDGSKRAKVKFAAENQAMPAKTEKKPEKQAKKVTTKRRPTPKKTTNRRSARAMHTKQNTNHRRKFTIRQKDEHNHD